MKKLMTFVSATRWFALAMLGFSLATFTCLAQSGKPKTFAQKLVEEMQTKHVDATEIGISMRSAHGCTTVASTDKSDIGEKCEKDDVEPMRTGKPYVEKEKDGFDVSVPLRDAAGKLIGSLGVEFKPTPDQTQAEVIGRAQKIANEMASEIPSKAKLLELGE